MNPVVVVQRPLQVRISLTPGLSLGLVNPNELWALAQFMNNLGNYSGCQVHRSGFTVENSLFFIFLY